MEAGGRREEGMARGDVREGETAEDDLQAAVHAEVHYVVARIADAAGCRRDPSVHRCLAGSLPLSHSRVLSQGGASGSKCPRSSSTMSQSWQRATRSGSAPTCAALPGTRAATPSRRVAGAAAALHPRARRAFGGCAVRLTRVFVCACVCVCVRACVPACVCAACVRVR